MQREYARKLRILYGIFLGVLTGLIAVMLIAEAAQLYYSGSAAGVQIYSRAIVGERLRLVLVPMIVWLVCAVLGYVVSVLVPYAEKRAKRTDARLTLRRLKKRMPQGEGKEFFVERKKLVRYEIIRVAVWSLVALFALASAIVTIVYLANASHFKSLDVNGEILALVRNTLPWIGASLLLVMGATFYESLSAKWELESMKKLLVLGRGAPLSQSSHLAAQRGAAAKGAKIDVYTLVVRIVLLIAGLTLLVLGIVNGGAQDVLIKAINICTECIGLG